MKPRIVGLLACAAAIITGVALVCWFRPSAAKPPAGNTAPVISAAAAVPPGTATSIANSDSDRSAGVAPASATAASPAQPNAVLQEQLRAFGFGEEQIGRMVRAQIIAPRIARDRAMRAIAHENNTLVQDALARSTERAAAHLEELRRAQEATPASTKQP